MANKKKKKTLHLIFLVIVITLIALFSFLKRVYKETIDIDTFYKGTSIAGLDVSGLTKEQALAKVMVVEDDLFKDKKLVLEANEYEVALSPVHFGFEAIVNEAVDEAYLLGRTGNPIERFLKIKGIREGAEYPIRYTYDENKVMETIKQVADALNIEPTEGEFSFKNGRIIATRGESGFIVDEEDLKIKIVDYLQTQIFSQRDIVRTSISIREVPPNSSKDFSRINGLIGEFSTSIASSTADRKYNVKVAADSLDNLLLMPGDEVSFNQKTGMRTVANGYKNASIIQNGKFEDGVGGGVCQVSTTLYNALIRAGVEVLERYNHSIPVNYIDLGFDAAVNDSNMDFKFKNSFDFPIFIKNSVDGKNIKFLVYGDKNAAKVFDFKVEEDSRINYNTIEETDNSMPINSRVLEREGRPGIRATTYRWVRGTDEREVLAKSNYPKIDALYKVGPYKSIAKPTQTSTEDTTEDDNTSEEAFQETVEQTDDIPYVDPTDPNNNAVPDGY